MTLQYGKAFRRDYKVICKRKRDIDKLEKHLEILLKIDAGHNLKGKLTGKRKCHMGFDWVLVYEVVGDAIKLLRTGTHRSFKLKAISP